MKIFIALLFTFGLTGCGLILGGLEDRTDATKAEVERTNSNMLKTNEKLDTTIGRLDQLIDGTDHLKRGSAWVSAQGVCTTGKTAGTDGVRVDPAVRIANCMVMFAYSEIHDEDNIYRLIAAQRPVTFPATPDTLKNTEGETRSVSLRNATIHLPPDAVEYGVYADYFYYLREASLHTLKSLLLAVSTNTTKLETLEERAEKLIFIGTAVLGAGQTKANLEIFSDGATESQFVVPVAERLEFAKGLLSVHASLKLGETDSSRPAKPVVSKDILEALIETRLGITAAL